MQANTSKCICCLSTVLYIYKTVDITVDPLSSFLGSQFVKHESKTIPSVIKFVSIASPAGRVHHVNALKFKEADIMSGQWGFHIHVTFVFRDPDFFIVVFCLHNAGHRGAF